MYKFTFPEKEGTTVTVEGSRGAYEFSISGIVKEISPYQGTVTIQTNTELVTVEMSDIVTVAAPLTVNPLK